MQYYGKHGDEWLDWVNVKWKFSDDTTHILPARILLFIDIESTIQMNNYNISESKRETCPVGKC